MIKNYLSNQTRKRIKTLVLLLLFSSIGNSLFAVIYYARTTGSWTPGTSTSTVFAITSCATAVSACNPGATDEIQVCAGVTLTVLADGTINNLGIAATGILKITSTKTLTVNGTFTNAGTVNSSASAGGILALAGAGPYTLPGGAFGTTSTTGVSLIVGTASQATTVNVTLDLLVSNLTVNNAGSTVAITNTKTLSVGVSATANTGALTCNGTISGAGGIMQFDGNASTYSGTGSILNTGGINIGQAELRTIGAGSSLTFAVWTQTSASGLLTIGDGVTATTLTINGAMQAGGTTSAVIISANAILNVGTNLSAASGTFTVSNSGTANITGNIVGTSASNSKWTQSAATAVLNVGGALLTTGTLTASTSGNTVNYNGAAQTIKVPATNYYHITLSGSNTKTHPGGTISVNGDWTNNGVTLDASTNTGTVSFTGTAAQNILGTSSTTFYNLTMNNSYGTSPQVTLGVSATVSNTLTLTDGNISLVTYDLFLTNATTTAISGGSSASYVITASTGLLKRTVSGATTYAFPLGSNSSTAYNPASIVWSAAPGVTRLDGKYTATTASTGTGLPVTTSSCLSVSTLVDNGYWTFAIGAGALSNAYDITLTRNGHTNAGTDLQDHAIVRRNNSGTAWTDPGTWAVTSSATISPANTGQIASITHTGVSTASGFGEFALAKGTNSAPNPGAISGGNTSPCYAPVGTPTSAFTNSLSGGVWSITNGTGSATIGAGTGIVTGTSTGSITVNYTVTTGGDCATLVTYPYVVVNFLGGYFDYDQTGAEDYATQNALGHCYNNLSAGTYCFNYINPSSGEVTLGGILDPGSSGCGVSGVSTAWTSDAASGTADLGSLAGGTWYGNCAQITGHQGGGVGSNYTPGGVYTTCITISASCAGSNYCPIIDCASGFCSAGALPIELLYFDAKLKGEIVELNWATATETNNDFFTLEKTVDGNVFFSFVKEKGAGNSTSTIQYNSVDEHPFTGLSYYRLKQTDYDGKFAYSKLIPVNLDPFAKLDIKYVLGDANKNTLQYQLSSANTRAISVQVLDVLGNSILTERIGSNPDGQTLYIDASNLSKGAYILRVSDGDTVAVKKFVY